MLQLLLMVCIAIGVVCCQLNCPIYSTFKNDVSIINELNGTFYKIIATGASTAPCQRQSFTIGPNNNIVNGYLQSSDWCLHMTNCDSSNPAYYQCDLVPITPVRPPTLPSAQRNNIKIVKKIGTGESLCLLYSYCRISEEGVYLLCRKPLSSGTTLLEFIVKFINSFTTLPDLKLVNQVNCTFLNTCPPSP